MSDTHVSMKRLGLKLLLVAFLGLLLMATSKIAQAQTETILYAFCSEPNCADGMRRAISMAQPLQAERLEFASPLLTRPAAGFYS
jgi:hypothetical protein